MCLIIVRLAFSRWHLVGRKMESIVNQVLFLLPSSLTSNAPLSFFTGQMPFLPPIQQHQRGQMQICIWPSRCHCHLLSLAPVNPDWFYFPGFTFLVLAHPGNPGQNLESHKLVVVVIVVLFVLLLFFVMQG